MKKKAFGIVLNTPRIEELLKSLPELDDDRSPARGCLWFCDKSDQRFWRSILKAETDAELLLSAGAYSLQLRHVTGYDRLKEMEGEATRIIYLPLEGVSDRRLYRWLSVHQAEAPCYLVRLFGRNSLAIYQGEPSPLTQLWGTVRAEFESSPFLGLDDETSLADLREWLARLVILSNLREVRPQLEERMRRDAARAGELCRAWTYVPRDVGSKPELLNLLLLRDYGRSVYDRLEKSRTNVVSAVKSLDEFPAKMDARALACYDASGKKVFGMDFVVSNLGGELLPELQALVAELSPFADLLISDSLPLLKSLGEELRDRLNVRSPMMALVGPFSSGKTTLLNILLGSNRVFRTAPTANTAIISEISSCEDDGRERVAFTFHDKVVYRLLEIADGRQSLSHPKNIRALCELIERGVLKHPQLIYYFREGGKRATRYSKEANGRDVVLKELQALKTMCDERAEEIIFQADVDAKTRRQELGASLPEKIYFSDEEDWHKFQGDGKEADSPFVEGVVASFLIQAADIRLRNNLLKLTAIADTPGTGSFNDLHDAITQQYLGRAEGIILLLPTKGSESLRVHRIMRSVRERCSLDQIAFVVNCHLLQNEQDWEERIRAYEENIRSEFELSEPAWRRRQSNPLTTNFFVLKLKTVEEGANPREALGRPSLTALRTWIRRLFRSGMYRERLAGIQRLLVKEWDERRTVINEKIAEFDLEAKETASRLAAVKAFRLSTLDNTKRRYLEEIEAVKAEFATGSHSPAKKAERALSQFFDDPLDKSRLDALKEELRGLYGELNKQLSELERHDPAARWADEMKSALAAVRVEPPSLVPPDPQDQSLPWGPATRFSLFSLDQKFSDIEAKWPTWFRKVQNIVGQLMGREDIRRAIAKDLRDVYWPAHYSAVWNDRLAAYLQRCVKFIETKTSAIRDNCLEREKNLREHNEETKKTLQHVVKVLSTFDGPRNKFIAKLEKELAKGSDNEHQSG